ncbi:MAG: DUF3987 domain-containing protein [Candidatus Obscuribacter sp.]|nr:DUF3987 domain-containing protein [Candidatus Obscuribacter sp.]
MQELYQSESADARGATLSSIAAISVQELRACADGECIDVPWPDLVPLTIEREEAAQAPIEALGDILGPAAKAVIEVVQAPAAVVCHSFLAGANLATQRLHDIEIDGRRSPISNYFLTVCDSGERKSGADRWAMAPFTSFEDSAKLEHREASAEYKTKKEAHEVAKQKAMKQAKGSPAQIEQALLALGEPPEAPIEPYIICSDPTFEGLLRLLDAGCGNAGIFTEEGAKFVGGHAMNSENKLKTIAGLNVLHDDGRADKMRSVEGLKKMRGKRLAMHLMLQPGVASKLVQDGDAQDVGFIARCLITAPEKTLKQYVEKDLTHDPALVAYSDRVLQLMHHPSLMVAGSRNELDPPVLRLAPDAKRAYIAFHNRIQREKFEGGHEGAAAHAAKAHDLAARISANLFVFDHGAGNGEISLHYFELAQAIVEHSLFESRRLANAAPDGAKEEKAERLLKWMKQRAQLTNSRELSLRDLQQYGPFRRKEECVKCLSVLIEHGYIRPANKEGKTNIFQLRPE